MWRSFPLAGDHDGDVHDDELVAGVELGGAAVGDEGGGVGGVVHVGDVAVRRELHQLRAGADPLPRVSEHAELHQRRPVPPAPEAEEHLGGAEAAVVEVGGEAAGRHVQQLVVVGHVLPEAGEDDGDVCDGVLVVARLEVHLEAALLQRLLPPRRREAAHHEVVRDPAAGLRGVPHAAVKVS